MLNAPDDHSHLSMEALEQAVRAADSCALFVPAWLLQKIASYDRAPGVNAFAMHGSPAHLIARGRLMEIAQEEELPLAAPPDGKEVLLLARPETDQLASIASSRLLLHFWRLMFKTRVHSAVRAQLMSRPNPPAAVQQRIERLDRVAFNEARFVLLRERQLAASADEIDAYAGFAAVYLDFSAFLPEMLSSYFPSIEHRSATLRLLEEDVDWEPILKSTQPAGAVDAHARMSGNTGPAISSAARSKRGLRRDAAHREKLLARAAKADAAGNDVRAAIFKMRVYRAAGLPGPQREGVAAVYADALRDLDQLTSRLKAALRLDDAAARQWRAWLATLLENAAGGWWNAEGRLLYDLQKVCVYHEREIYSINIVDYFAGLMRRPLRRPQPGQRLVLSVKSLKSALRRTARVRLSPEGRAELRRLLRAALDDLERRLRDFLRPPVAAALDDGGLRPRGAVETVARHKLTEELLDEIVDGGYLTFPAVRDAVSRNQMKLDDLNSLVRRDQLLRIDRTLEDNLDYVYHRGEIYLRGFHRLSSIFFATRIGRLLTKFIILPVGGAFLTLEALDHSVGLLIHKLSGHVATLEPGTQHAKYPPIFSQLWLLAILSLFLFGLINFPPFRAAVANAFRQSFRLLRAALVDFPAWVIHRPMIQAILKSRFARNFGRYVLKPLAVAALAYLLVPNAAGGRAHVITLAGVFLAVNLLLNSRAGRAIEQAILHTLRTTFARFTWDIIVAVIRGVMQLFQGLLEAIDRVLYAVDELLRFRAGQKRTIVAVKAVLGIVWFYIAYVTRFAINLLVEPQINPIKHFPVVTVSHKLILPTTPYIAAALQRLKFAGVGIEPSRAWATAGLITLCTPGIFGFLAWEFRENWKLYKANRSRNLRPLRVGGHGETVATFLRPGFHSGTIPKIFHRLRKAQLLLWEGQTPSNKHVEAAHHVERALESFFEREWIALLNRHPLFAGARVSLGRVELAVTRIRVEFLLEDDDEPLAISFEQRVGWIIAGVDAPGWLARLDSARSDQMAAAILGLYKLAGADMIREQVRGLFAPHDVRFDLRHNNLIVWPTADFSVEAVYDLSSPGPIIPRFTTVPRDVRLPALTTAQILFRFSQLPRDEWNHLWEAPTALPPASIDHPLPALNIPA